MLERTWMRLCDEVSDGDTLCTGCWDSSGNNIHRDNNIPSGDQIWFVQVNYEYDEHDPYCRRCAFQHVRWQEWMGRNAHQIFKAMM